MKFLCPHCERLLELEQFTLEGGVLVVSCGKCGAESRATAVPGSGLRQTSPPTTPSPRPELRGPPRVSLTSSEGASNVVQLRTASHDAVARAAAAADTPFATPEGSCPKCLARRRPDAPECPHCGVRFELFEESTVLPPQFLRAEWVELLKDWGNEARHQSFRRKAQQLDALPAIGRLYRVRQSNFPEDPFAAEALTDILRLAAVPIGSVVRDDAAETERRQRIIIIAVLIVGGLLAALLLGVMLRD